MPKRPAKYRFVEAFLVFGTVYWVARGLVTIETPVGIAISIGILTSLFFWEGFFRIFKRFRTVRIMFPESDRALAEDLGKPLPPEPPSKGITKDSEDPRKYIAK